MRTRAAQIVLAAVALFVGVIQPAFNGLSLLALTMVALAGCLEWRIQASRAAGAVLDTAGKGREAA